MMMASENNSKLTNSSLRTSNRKRVFDLLFDAGELTQAEIKERTGLSGPTVTQSLYFFKDRKLFTEGEVQASSGGRKAHAIAFDYQAFYAVGVEIRVHHVDIRIIDLKGKLHSSKVYRLVFANNGKYWDEVNRLVTSQINSEEKFQRILGVGIAFPGEINMAGDYVTRATVLGVRNLSIKEIQSHFAYPVYMNYGADAAGFGTVWRSKHIRDAVYIVVTDNGIAGSVIINNQLYHGAGGKAGAFGHIVLEPKGKPCFCGGRGCWSAYCSINSLIGEEDGDLLAFFNAVESGDEKANQQLDDYLVRFAQGIANVLLSFDADIIIGGKLVPYFSNYLPRLTELVSAYPSLGEDKVDIRLDLSSSSPMAEGAALQLVSRFLNDELDGYHFEELETE